MNGKELLGYARFRADAEGDFGRVARQQEVISAMKDEAIRPGMITNVPKLAGALSGFIDTDLTSKDEISRAISLLMKKGADVETMTVPVKGSYSFNSYAHAGSVIEVDIAKNKEAIVKIPQYAIGLDQYNFDGRRGCRWSLMKKSSQLQL